MPQPAPFDISDCFPADDLNFYLLTSGPPPPPLYIGVLKRRQGHTFHKIMDPSISDPSMKVHMPQYLSQFEYLEYGL